jgi:hypothetical protein
MINITENKDVMGLKSRSDSRELTLMTSTMSLVASYVTDGDTKDDAKVKVKAVSDEITSLSPGAKYDFVLGNTQPLKDAVQALATNATLAHFTQAKADVVLNILNTAV